MSINEKLINKLSTLKTNELIVIGKKDSGKTFNFLNMCDKNNWKEVYTGKKIYTFSLLQPYKLNEQSKELLNKCFDGWYETFGFKCRHNSLLTSNHIIRLIEKRNQDWKVFWENSLIRPFQLKNTIKNLNNILIMNDIHLFLLVDGLDDYFYNADIEPEHDFALTGLLDLINKINKLKNNHIKIIIFMCPDMIKKLMKDSSKKFNSLYNVFVLDGK